MDRYWAQKYRDHKVPRVPRSELTQRQRSETQHPLSAYSYFNFLYYVLYSPFFLAGPIITFNDFIHQTIEKPITVNLQSSFRYLLRWVFALLLMETMMHYFYVVSIKNRKAWTGFTPIEIFTLGFFNLKMIWLKVSLK
jgi:D-alanyl-lipoteichoic acid acyltransferase DltB (MBOAT superfamily)